MSQFFYGNSEIIPGSHLDTLFGVFTSFCEEFRKKRARQQEEERDEHRYVRAINIVNLTKKESRRSMICMYGRECAVNPSRATTKIEGNNLTKGKQRDEPFLPSIINCDHGSPRTKIAVLLE